MSNVSLECPQTLSLAEMRREAKRMARARGLPFYIELYQANGGNVDTSTGAVTGNHVVAYTVDVKNGMKTPVRGVNLEGNALSILQSIVAVGEEPLPRHGQCISYSGTIPLTETSPPLLSEGLPYQRVITINEDQLEFKKGKKRYNLR
jgi:predicted Zn-dependent protease